MRKLRFCSIACTIAFMISSCSSEYENLVSKWYLHGVVNLKSNEQVIQNDCQYLFLNINGSFETKGFIKENGTWTRNGKTIILIYEKGKKEILEIQFLSENKMEAIITYEQTHLKFIFNLDIPETCL